MIHMAQGGALMSNEQKSSKARIAASVVLGGVLHSRAEALFACMLKSATVAGFLFFGFAAIGLVIAAYLIH
jgi:hypothetical protein